MNQEKNEVFEEFFDYISMLDTLLNKEFMNIEEYTKIKNRILDRMIEANNQFEDINAEK